MAARETMVEDEWPTRSFKGVWGLALEEALSASRLAFLALAKRRRAGVDISFPMLAIMRFKKLAPLMDGYRSLAASVAKTGLSTPLSSMTLKRRRELGLPELKFQAEEARKILEALGLLSREGESG